jgi:LPXTG-motif cell wall-anchored protein
MSTTAFRKSGSIAVAIVLIGGGFTLLSAAPASAAATCVVPHGAIQTFGANANTTYSPPAGTGFVEVTASGGAGSLENDDQVPGAPGALVKSAIAVPAGGTFALMVGQDASHSTGGQSGGGPSGGAGDDYSTPDPFFSGGGGGATFVTNGVTPLVVAAGGGGAGFGNAAGVAGPASANSEAAGAVTSGGDGGSALPVDNGGKGGSTVPGAGGTGDTQRGSFNGHDGVGSVGGDAFTEVSNPGQSVGAGGGGGGYKGGGGGGVGGFSGGGGAGSSFSASAYTIQSNGTAAPSVEFEAILKPVFSSATSTSFTQEKTSSFTVCAPAVDDPAITEVGALPAGVTFVDNGDGTATLAGKPTGGTGKFPLTFTSTGLGGVTTQSFVLSITTSDELAVTGTDAAPAGLLAIALLLGGGAVLWLRRRRPARD